MGKKKGGKAPPKSAAAEERDLPQWHAALPSATAENVLELPQVDHGWVVTIIDADRRKHKFGILAILDVTNRVRGEGTAARFQNIGPCPNPRKDAGGIARALLATMIRPQPAPRGDSAEYFSPRRPAWVLIEKDLSPCLAAVKDALAEVDVVVKLNTPEALAEGAEEGEDANGRTATWQLGLEMGATADNVGRLGQKDGETWKMSMVMLEDEGTGAKECFVAVEDVTRGADEDSSYPLGAGPCAAPTANPDGLVRAVFATMLAPRAEGGGLSKDQRRPGRLILDGPLEPWAEHLQERLGAVGVAVELA